MKLSLSTAGALTLTSLLMVSQPAAAQEQDTQKNDSVTNDAATSEGLWGTFKRNVTNVWQSDQYDLYVPFWTWHNRLTYDKEKTDTYNEKPWGAGFGKSYYDEDNDWHSLYAMAFKDSHNKWEPIVGYGFQKMWMPQGQDGFKAGIGFTIGVTARDDYHYIPIPVPLPLASVEYNRLAIQATYIPGTYNNGNVLFMWARWQF
ncbi:lipid IV(A) palmitoyltransferase PagP [Morganella morganii]|uniref:lipid IV(A) palmitoyltransferase PagP n=1 Tax=Morganella morganii TaxID=582 RepID=UPI0032DB31D6